MTRSTLLSHLLAALLGAALCWVVLGRDKVSGGEYRAVREESARNLARVLDLTGERDSLRAAADSLRARRPVVIRQVLASPDSAARAEGLAVTAPDSGTRCLPVDELAGLLADRAALRLCDTEMALRDSAGARGDSALTLAVETAERCDTALGECAVGLGREKRLRWLWAAGGALAAVLAVLGAGAL